MKNIIIKAIVFAVLFTAGTSTLSSQIKVLKNEELRQVGKIESVGMFKKDKNFTITYQDINTSNLNTYRSINFKDQDGAVESLYAIFQESLTKLPDSDILLEFPNDLLRLHFEKNMGQNTVQIIHIINKNRKYVGKSHFLTKRDIDIIFGKK